MKILSLLIFLLSSAFLNAQNVAIGISNTTLNPDATLELESTTSGFLMPRMTKAQRDAITSPTIGLLVYQTDFGSRFKYYRSLDSGWVNFGLKNFAYDNLGNHMATRNTTLDNYWISNDGDNEGIRVDNNGNVGVGVANPTEDLVVQGDSVQISDLVGSDTRIVLADDEGDFYTKELPWSGSSISLSSGSASSNETITTALTTYKDADSLSLNLEAGTYIIQVNAEVDTDVINTYSSVGFFIDDVIVATSETTTRHGALAPVILSIFEVITLTTSSTVNVQFKKSSGDPGSKIIFRGRTFIATKIF